MSLTRPPDLDTRSVAASELFAQGVAVASAPGLASRAAEGLSGRHPDSAGRRAAVHWLFAVVAQVVCAALGVMLLMAMGQSLALVGLEGPGNATLRLWAVFFPVVVVLFGIGRAAVFFAPRWRAAVRVLHTAWRTLAAVMLLNGLLVAGGVASMPWPMMAALAAVFFSGSMVAQLMLSRTGVLARQPIRVALVGADDHGIEVARALQRRTGEVQVVGFIDDRRSRIDLSKLPAPWLGSLSDALQASPQVQAYVLALPSAAEARVETMARALRGSQVDVYLAPEAALLRSALVRQVDHPALQSFTQLGMGRLAPPSTVIKRAFDIVLSLVALGFFLPFGLLLALLIKLESPGPVFFRQQRYGLGHRLFLVYKFRSMRHDPQAAKGEIRLTERGDARLTRLGAFLRSTSLDEFPQFLNVLRGEMSVVGPRPHPPGVKAGERVYEEVVADFMERYKVPPGITGWAQVNGCRGNTFTEDDLTRRFAYDIQYMRHWSFEFDMLVVLMTVVGGFGGKNAF